ncbi:MAG TPA: 3-isopropylmalate dehydratase large subunit [Candidatus Obscuribacterales bacterium]
MVTTQSAPRRKKETRNGAPSGQVAPSSQAGRSSQAVKSSQAGKSREAVASGQAAKSREAMASGQAAKLSDVAQPKNIVEKIWDLHVVKQLEGHPAVFAVDLMLLHEVTSAQAFQTLDDKGLNVFDPSRLLATIDHSIPTRQNRWEIYDDAARTQVETLRNNCLQHGIPFLDYEKGQGIVHVVGPELGLTQPGMTIVCGDSHTSTHGAFGALAFGIGTSEVGHVLATGCLLQQKPKSMRVEFKGHFQKGVHAKDAILRLIADIGVGGANGHVIEYVGEAVRNMSMEERMTVCNMSIECGARAGLIAPDETTYAYLKGRPHAPKEARWREAVRYWNEFQSDAGCNYDRQMVIDLDVLQPMVTWGTNPSQAVGICDPVPSLDCLDDEQRPVAKRALEYTGLREGCALEGTPIDWAFVGSCTNGRIEDLRVAASILKGKRVHDGVTMYVVPGSEAVMRQAFEEGLPEIFQAAGAQFRMPGCSMCLAMNDDRVPAGKRCISSSNRNFVGRQGPGSITHLASPATVAASAIEGKISSPVRCL